MFRSLPPNATSMPSLPLDVRSRAIRPEQKFYLPDWSDLREIGYVKTYALSLHQHWEVHWEVHWEGEEDAKE